MFSYKYIFVKMKVIIYVIRVCKIDQNNNKLDFFFVIFK